MFEDKSETFKIVYNLALNVNLENKNKPKSYRSGDDSEKLKELIKSPDKNSARYKLEDYLESLDFETIKIIQTIMYLGRDKEYDELPRPELRYKKLREYFGKSGWSTKEIEINQMVSKMPFSKYLKDGFEILGIKYY